MTKQFNLIAFQDQLIEKFEYIEANGVGDHKSRSRSRARRNARDELIERGWTYREADAAVQQAWNVYQLQAAAE